MKRTNIVLDEALLSEGMSLTGIRTRRELVHKALTDLVRRGRQRRIRELKGAIRWEGDLDETRATD